MKASSGLWYLAVNALVYSFIGSARSEQTCAPPDVPVKGNYVPRRSKFLLGDRVSYICQEGFILMGRDARACMLNGTWSNRTPFCDEPAKLKNPYVSSGNSANLSNLIDTHTNTCFLLQNSLGGTLRTNTNDQVVLYAVRIYLERGTTKLQIHSILGKHMTLCSDFDRYLEIGQWIFIKCQNSDVLADSIKITNKGDTKSNVTICEMQVYGKDEYGCDHPPGMRIENGFFEVGRNKATLQCVDGFTATNSRLVCEGNAWRGPSLKCDENLCDPFVNNSTLNSGSEWIFLDSVRKLSPGTRRQLSCSAGYRSVGGPETVTCQKNGMWTKTNATCIEEKPRTSTQSKVMIAAGTVVLLIILLLLGITIYLVKRQRNRKVVVVFKPSTDGSVTSGTESEYAAAYYETVQGRAPILPTTQRPSPIPPVLNDGYILHKDCKRTLNKQKPMPADIAFGTLKQSDLYGN